MIGIDIVILVVGVSILALIGGLIGRNVEAKREADDAKRKGASNHEAPRQAAERICIYCHKAIDPKMDIYESKKRHWWCRGCWSSFN